MTQPLPKKAAREKKGASPKAPASTAPAPGRASLGRRLGPYGLASLAGVLYFLGFVGFGIWPLSFVAFVPWLFALRTAPTWKAALRRSWWMGFVTMVGGFFWVVHLLRQFAHLPEALSIGGMLLLALAQGLLFGVSGLLGWGLWRRARVPLGLAVAVAQVAVEFTFPLLFDFYTANAWTWVPWLIQIADFGGVLLVTFLVVLVNGALYEALASLWDRRPFAWKVPAGAALALALTVGYAAVRMPAIEARDAAAPKLRTAIVQANVGASMKHDRVSDGIARFKRMTDQAMRRGDVDLVVWPESGYFRPVWSGRRSLDGDVATEVSSAMILGAIRYDRGPDGKTRRWNSALALAPGGEIVGHYDKTALLAFGEYVPGDRIWPGIYDLLPYSGHFERGTSTAPLPVGPWRLSTDICYEDILPGMIRRLMGPVDAEGNRPNAMVNITNDSWYGPHEPPVHLALAAWRAVEHRRWLVRSTATGISAFVDSTGRLVKKSGFETAETLLADVPMVTAGPTVYDVVGDWPGWLALALAALGLLWPRLRRGRVAG